MIIAKRDKLLSYDDTIKELNLLRENDLRSGNKCFKIITKNKRRKIYLQFVFKTSKLNFSYAFLGLGIIFRDC